MKVKKLLVFLILLFCIFNVKALELNISSKNAVLYNAKDDEVLYEKDSSNKVQIASLTKIMTALVVLDNVDDLDKQIIVNGEDLKGLAEANLVTAGFTVGSVVTYRDLLYGLLLPSGADAANVLTRNISDDFINLMNNKVQELKLENTHFSNAIGLDDENNYSSAKDLLIIFKKALENEDFRKIITTKQYTTSDGKLTFNSTVQGNSRKYNIDVSYIEGAKTGTTDGGGLCLASFAKDDNVELILVTTGALYDKKRPHNIDDAKTIYDYFIKNYNNQKVVEKSKSFKSLKTKYATVDEVKIYPSKDVIKYLADDYDRNDIKYKYQGKKVIKYNTRGKIGILKIYYKDILLDTQKVYMKQKLKFSIQKFIIDNILYIALGFGLLMILFVVVRKKKNS